MSQIVGNCRSMWGTSPPSARCARNLPGWAEHRAPLAHVGLVSQVAQRLASCAPGATCATEGRRVYAA